MAPQPPQPEPAPAQPAGTEAAGDAEGSLPEDKPPVPMTENAIRDAGYMIDVPYEAPDVDTPDMAYAEGEAEAWTPPEGFSMGGTAWDALPPLDPEVAARFGLGGMDEESPTGEPTPEA